MSRHDKLSLPLVIGSSVTPMDDGRLQIDIRLRLDELIAVEESQLRTARAGRGPTAHELVEIACKIVEARRVRHRLMGTDLFGEPAWDMLLDLYTARKRGQLIGPTSLAMAANVPPTTGFRWQKVLIRQGLIERGPDGVDHRRQIMRLTEKGRAMMDRYLTRLFDAQWIASTETGSMAP